MLSLRKSPGALVGTLLIVVAVAASLPLTGRAQNPNRPQLARGFYLTETLHFGDEALTACAAGYHMASLWEILDPSNLRYDTQLGFSQADSGVGPPSEAFGWIRTGSTTSGGNTLQPPPNCGAWTSRISLGTVAWLSFVHQSSFDPGFHPEILDCDIPNRVWCVAD